MVEFLKFLKGYVYIKVSGFSPERFMNLCSNRDILLWNIKKEQDAYYMCISITGFYQLKPIVKKTKTKVAIVKKCGLPFFVPRILKRKFFVLGFLLAAFFWIMTSKYIWAINISGNFMITRDVFMDFLEEENVFIGMKKNTLDIESLEKAIRQNFYEVTWTSAKLEGTKLSIELKENELLKEETKTMPSSSDLIAETEGTVVSMIVREGVPQVKIGDEVEKDQLLVAGSVPVYNEDGTIRKYQYCNADADIFVEHNISIKEILPLHYEKKTYTGRTKKQLQIGLLDYMFSPDFPKMNFRTYDVITNTNQLRLLPDFYLPVFYGICTYREYYLEECKYSESEAKEKIQEKYLKILASLEQKGVQIIAKDVKIDTYDSKWVLSGIFTVQEKIGETRAIIEESYEDAAYENAGNLETNGLETEE